MGIPGFNSYFYDSNKQAYQPMAQTTVDHLYVDMNSVLHNVLRKAENYDKYHALLHKRLDAILRLTNPRKSVMLAIDGPAPLAKLMTQRERRKKTFNTEARKKGANNSSNISSSKPGGKKRKSGVVSSTALTPGTPFMHDVCVSCSYFICARLANRKWQHLEWELSGPTVAGEGEVKILGRLARPRHDAAVGPHDTHLIVGDDADLILMALVSNTPHLHILNAALSDNTMGPKTAVLSVDRLNAVWISKGIIGPAAASGAAQCGLSRAVLLQLLGAKADLAVLAILSSGNDYLPPVKGGPGLQGVWDSYVKLRQLPQFANRSIVTMTTNTLQQQQHGAGSSSSSSSSETGAFMRELAVSAELDVIMLAEVLAVATAGHKYLNKYLKAETAAAAAAPAAAAAASCCQLSKEAADALPWLKGLLWTMSMYFAGDCPDYRWCYTGGVPTTHGIRALAAAAAAAAAQGGSSSSSVGSSDQGKLRLSSFSLSCCSSDGSGSSSAAAVSDWQAAVAAAAARVGGSSSASFEPLLPHICSLALLPAGAQEHVPSAVQHLMDSTSPIYDMYATCDGCEEVAQEMALAQTAYNAVLDQLKAVEAQLQTLQSQQGDTQQQQQQLLDQLCVQQCELTAAKAAALAGLHAAADKRRSHEAQQHPQGVHSFDLCRLEAAVAAIPASSLAGHERALTQFSHSLMFRMGTPPQQQHRQQYGQYNSHQYGQQQQQQQSYSSSSSNAQLPGRMYRPPPPPVERFGPACYNSSTRGSVVLRSILWETALSCRVQEDKDLAMYSRYMVLGTEAAAAAAAGAEVAEATAADAAASGAAHHKRKHSSPLPASAADSSSNGAAAAALKALLKQGSSGTPTQLVQKVANTGDADSAAAAALDVVSAALAAQQLSQPTGQQQQKRHKQQQQQIDTDAQQQTRRRSKSPKSHSTQQQQRQRGRSPARYAGGGGSSSRSEHTAAAAAAAAQPPAPAAQHVPMPSNLLSRTAAAAGTTTAAAVEAYQAPGGSSYGHTHNYTHQGASDGYYGQQQQQYSQYQQPTYYQQQQYQQYQQQQPPQHDYYYNQQQQYSGGGYNPLQHQRQPQQHQQPYSGAYNPVQQRQQQQHVVCHPLQHHQQPHVHLQYQPLRDVPPSTGSSYAYSSSSAYGVVPRPVLPPASAAAATRPPYPGMPFP